MNRLFLCNSILLYRLKSIAAQNNINAVTDRKQFTRLQENWSARVAESTISEKRRRQGMYGYAVHSIVRENQPVRQGRFLKRYWNSCLPMCLKLWSLMWHSLKSKLSILTSVRIAP